MFSLFKRKKSSLEDHLRKVVSDTSLDFQLDVIRNNDIDFQVVRQRMLKSFDDSIRIKDPNGFGVIISFNMKTQEGLRRFNQFKSSKLFDLFEEVQNIDDMFSLFVLKSRNNLNLILDYVSQIQTEVYGYDDNTYYYFKYKEI